MQTILLSISFANSTYSKERSKKLADSISSLRGEVKKVSCYYFSKTDIGQKKVSHPFCQCVSLNWLRFQEAGAVEATLEHIIFNVVPMGGPLLGPSIFYHLVIKRHVKKHGYEVRKWGTPSFLNTLDKRQKQGLLIRRKNTTDDRYDMWTVWTFFRIVDTLKCVYIQRLKRARVQLGSSIDC